jgi:glycosyltransferase 2 family protein
LDVPETSRAPVPAKTPAKAPAAMPAEFSARHLRARLLQLAALVIVVAALVWLSPGLGELRGQLKHASAPWFGAAGVVEVLSTLSYVVIFRAVFCARMSWRSSYQIGMAEQAANSLLPAGGAGGLALGAWALNRVGMSANHIARRTVAFFLLTSLANVGCVALFAAVFALGIFGHDAQPGFTYGFGGAALLGIAVTLSLPAWYGRWVSRRRPLPVTAGRLRRTSRHVVDALGEGTADAIVLLRRRPVGVLAGSFGYMAFDIAALGCCFIALGHSPGFGVLVFAYLVGQLGGLLPLPGGIGGTEGGLIGVFALYQVPLAKSAAAVLAYRALQLWIPAALGSVAFVQLRGTLRRESHAETVCEPLAEPIEDVPGSGSVPHSPAQEAYAP